MTDFETLRKINEYLKARVVALELALEFYADEANWEWRAIGSTHVIDDRGQRARETLGRAKGE